MNQNVFWIGMGLVGVIGHIGVQVMGTGEISIVALFKYVRTHSLVVFNAVVVYAVAIAAWMSGMLVGFDIPDEANAMTLLIGYWANDIVGKSVRVKGHVQEYIQRKKEATMNGSTKAPTNNNNP